MKEGWGHWVIYCLRKWLGDEGVVLHIGMGMYFSWGQ